MIVKHISVLAGSLLLFACANTRITEDWLIEDHQAVYKHPMIIAMSDSQQTRQIYEKYFVAELKKKNITATPSYKLINSKQTLTRETVVAAIQGTEIDSVMVTYLIAADSEVRHHESPISAGYSSDIDNRMSATLIAQRGRARNSDVIRLKNDLYDANSKKLVWSVRTKTVAPDSIDHVVVDVVDLLIDEMFDDKLFIRP